MFFEGIYFCIGFWMRKRLFGLVESILGGISRNLDSVNYQSWFNCCKINVWSKFVLNLFISEGFEIYSLIKPGRGRLWGPILISAPESTSNRYARKFAYKVRFYYLYTADLRHLAPDVKKGYFCILGRKIAINRWKSPSHVTFWGLIFRAS